MIANFFMTLMFKDYTCLIPKSRPKFSIFAEIKNKNAICLIRYSLKINIFLINRLMPSKQ